MKTSPKYHNYDLPVVFFIVVILSGLAFLEASSGWLGLWGIAVWPVYPSWIQFCLLALVIIASAWGIRAAKVAATASRASQSFAPTLVWWGLAGVVTLAFVFLRTQNFLLGDALSIIDRTAHGVDFAQFSQANVWLHERIFYLLPGVPSDRSLLAYRITSIMSGIIMMIALTILNRDLRSRILSLAIFLTFGIALLYAGYVERYPITFAFMFLFLVLVHRDWQAKRIKIITIVVFVVATAMHLAVASLAPLLIYVVLMKQESRARSVAFWTMMGLLVVAVFGFYLFTNQASEIFVPLTPTATNPYSLFSTERWHDLLNVALLSFPLIFVIPFIKSFWASENRVFFLLTILPCIAMTVLIDPKLGAIRDWDLMSFAATPILLASIIILVAIKKMREQAFPALTLALFAFALLHTGSWIFINSSRDNSQASLKLVIRNDLHYSAGYLKGIQNIQWSNHMSKLFDDISECLLAEERRLLGAPDDALNRFNYASNLGKHGELKRAAEVLSGHWHNIPVNPRYMNKVAYILESGGELLELERLYEFIIMHDSSATQLMLELSRMKEQRGVLDSAWMYYDKAVKQITDLVPGEHWKYLQLCIKAGKTREALVEIDKLRELASSSDRAGIHAISQSIESGDTAKALRQITSMMSYQ